MNASLIQRPNPINAKGINTATTNPRINPNRIGPNKPAAFC